eukprot:Nitzschia sp. Nitz4//scaffold98_size77359//65510//66820//NITZ4_005558-RA/size77359-processed-gene-0.153-mRNA-1//-1//CDS//3329560787//3756//frame0
MTDQNDETMSIQEQANLLYRGKALAPMVRASTTPLRTLAFEYGADFVYTEEFVDRSITDTIRVENATLRTIDYIKAPSQLSKKTQRKLANEKRPCLLFRMDPQIEQGNVVCQLGTGEPDLALAAAKHVYRDFAAIDVNMGCPKKFSVSGGMGSALLSDPDRAAKIISTLREHIPRPISCKVRLLATSKDTVSFIDRMIEAGANAVAIHARRVGHESVHPADWETLEDVMRQLRSKYPVFPFLLNGDFYDRKELDEMTEKTGASGILLGRPALYNTSIFRPTSMELEDKTKVIQNYLRHSARYDIHFKNPKYVVCEMMNNRRAPTTRVPFLPQEYPGQQTIAKTCNCTSLELIFKVWNLEWVGVGILENDDSKSEKLEESQEEALAPGEHRYEDSYFLKKRPKAPSHGGDNNNEPAAKKSKACAGNDSASEPALEKQ